MFTWISSLSIFLAGLTGSAETTPIASRNYWGDMTQDEYIDSKIGNSQYSSRKYYHSDGSSSLHNNYGNGHGSIYHSNGSKSIYQDYGNGHGSVYHSDGSKSVW